MPVTREEVADVLRLAFEQSSTLRRSEVIDAAIDNGARIEVVQVLAHLSETPFHRLQDLWADLADLPIDLETEGSR